MSLTEPLRFEAKPFTRVWGGRALDRFLPGGLGVEGPVGEVWELVDRDDTSSVVASGSLAGRTLRGLMLSERESLLGATRPAAEGHFPLVVKFLDASQHLSVQVHPDERVASRLGSGAAAKTECWYVLSAEPGGRGLRRAQAGRRRFVLRCVRVVGGGDRLPSLLPGASR